MVKRIVLPQQSWVSGNTDVLTPTMKVRGKIEQITVKINDNTGNITATVTITDEDSAPLYTKAGIPEATTTLYTGLSNKATQDADFNPFLADGLLTFTITPSGNPSTSGMTVDVALFVTGSPLL